MRKIQILGLSFVAVFAFSAIVASMASAETTLLALWLTKGNEFAGALASETKGKILLEDRTFKIAVECEGSLDGFVYGANGEDEVTEVLNTRGEKIGAPLSGLALECKKVAGCENNAKVWALDLPWHTLVFLLEGGGFWDLIIGAGPGYEIECDVLFSKISEECKSGSEGTGGAVTNAVGGVEAVEIALLPLANCTTGGNEVGANLPLKGDIITVAGEVLSVSSE
jgi:hypothetical protein